MNREIVSSLKFFQAVPSAQVTASVNGADIDTQGYDAIAVAVNIGALTSASTTSYFALRLQHTDASALGAGPSDYADCGSIDMIRFGTSAAVASGIWGTVAASTDSGEVKYVGYRGPKRYVRVVIEAVPATFSAAHYLDALAVLGRASQWPVATPNA
jgi:hypothetical protein